MSLETTQSWPAKTPDGNGQAPARPAQERYNGAAAYENAAYENTAYESGGTPYEPATGKPRLPSLDLEAPAEPVFSPDSWLDGGDTASLADHPLLRGLLLELPPRGSVPPPGWLDRWFEATRSILELLYVDDGLR